MRCLGEDGFGPTVHWTLHNSVKIVSTIITGLRSKPLSRLVAGYMINLPFQFHLFQETVIKFHDCLPAQQTAGLNKVQNTIQDNNVNNSGPVKGFRCRENHFLRECPVVACKKCAGQHNSMECRVHREKLVGTKCSLRGHTTRAHFGPVTKKITTNHLEPAESNVFTCGPGPAAATFFLDGAFNIGHSGKNSFV